MRRRSSVMGVLAALLVALLALASSAAAGGVVVVTPTHSQGWTEFIRAAGDVSFVADVTSPYPDGALQLTTDGDNDSGATYGHGASGSVASITDARYWTYQAAGPAYASASFVITLDLDGGDGSTGFTNLIFEPYWQNALSPDPAPVIAATWQQWDVDAGQFWSTRSYTDGANCNLTAGAGGPPFYTLADIVSNCPRAVVTGYGVNVGTYNPNYVIRVDGVGFNGTVYDFELTNVPADKDACKNGGWMSLTDSSGNAFVNQGQCVSSTVPTT